MSLNSRRLLLSSSRSSTVSLRIPLCGMRALPPMLMLLTFLLSLWLLLFILDNSWIDTPFWLSIGTSRKTKFEKFVLTKSNIFDYSYELFQIGFFLQEIPENVSPRSFLLSTFFHFSQKFLYQERHVRYGWLEMPIDKNINKKLWKMEEKRVFLALSTYNQEKRVWWGRWCTLTWGKMYWLSLRRR